MVNAIVDTLPNQSFCSRLISKLGYESSNPYINFDDLINELKLSPDIVQIWPKVDPKNEQHVHDLLMAIILQCKKGVDSDEVDLNALFAALLMAPHHRHVAAPGRMATMSLARMPPTQ